MQIKLPQSHADAIICSYSERTPEGFMGSGVPMDFINLQIWACNRTMENAGQKTQAIRVFLDQADVIGVWITAAASR
jgi:hypothetical protein